jgi:mRNA interferase HigB
MISSAYFQSESKKNLHELKNARDNSAAILASYQFFAHGVVVELPKWDYNNSMRIIALSRLRAFYEQDRYADAKLPLSQWHVHVKNATWTSPVDVKADFGNASILKFGRVVFNIAGNKYRLVVKINYLYSVIYIRFAGTHVEYNSIDAEKI